jgi:hypothetical protein
MGLNVPQLSAVPTLKENLPPGWFEYGLFPGSVYLVSWRKLGG